MKIRNLKNLVQKQKGQGLTEYLVLIGLMAVVSIGAARLFSSTVSYQMGGMAEELSGSANTGQALAAARAVQAVDAGMNSTNLGTYTDQSQYSAP